MRLILWKQGTYVECSGYVFSLRIERPTTVLFWHWYVHKLHWYHKKIKIVSRVNLTQSNKQEAAIRRCSSKFCNSHRKTPLLKLRACNSIEKRLQQRRFSVNIAKFLRTAFILSIAGGCFLYTTSWNQQTISRNKW